MDKIKLLCNVAQIITPISIIISSVVALYISLRHTRAKLKIKTTFGIIGVKNRKEDFVPFSTCGLSNNIGIDDIMLCVTFSNCGYCNIFVEPLKISISRKTMYTPFPVEPKLIKAGENSYNCFQFSQILNKLTGKQKTKWNKLKIHVYTSRGHFKGKLGTRKDRLRLNEKIKQENIYDK